ncbi:MAG: hypothetical protein IJQ39_14205 [Thermoguttaceae bacterium]|nr:hypothetical protein [Thermoguttaceae bacterium]
MKRLLAIAIVLLLTSSASAALTGATGCKAGELAVIRSDVDAVWTVYPQTYSASYAVSDDGKTLYFASPQEGKITVIAASVSDGQPVIDSHIIYNGVEVPSPDPSPEPTPEPEKETLESVIKSEAKDKDAAELTALAESFELVVDGIDRGTITTPTGARETFRRVWTEKGTAVKLTALDDLSALISAISSHIDNSTLRGLRGDYERAAAAVRSVLPAPAKESEPMKPQTQNGGCPNGQCPTTQNRWWYR